VKVVITATEAARLDGVAPVPVDVLMERAGRAVALEAVRMGAGYGTRVVVLAGPGNNGGDGYVAARHLRSRGVDVRVEVLGDPRTRLGVQNAGRARAAGVRVTPLAPPRRVDLAIDALFGGNFRGDLPPEVAPWLRIDAPVLAVDVPSGIDPDSGAARGPAFRATSTVTFNWLKTGHLLGAGPDHCGEIRVADIGLPSPEPELLLTEEGDAPRPLRARTAHKWSAGSVLVVGGGPGMVGAALLAGKAALNFGAGAVGVAVPDTAASIAAAAAPGLLHYSIDDLPTRYDVLIIGPGLGEGRGDLVGKLLAGWPGPLVIDADALAAVEPEKAISNRRAVLTPHAGEFERVTGVAPTYQAAAQLAASTGATILLKGNPTIVAAEGPPWLVNSGGRELATIGTGDVLAGMVGSLLAAGLDPKVAARSAAYWHGRAGADLAASRVVTAEALASHVGRFR
jgi:NAD(P)H-hydrate epimerase